MTSCHTTFFNSSCCIYFCIHSPVRLRGHLEWSTREWFASQPPLRPATRFTIPFDSILAFRTLINGVKEKEKYVKAAAEHVSPSSRVCPQVVSIKLYTENSIIYK